MWLFRSKNINYLSWGEYISEVHARDDTTFQRITSKKKFLKNITKESRDNGSRIDENTIKKVFSEVLRGLPISRGVRNG